MALRAISYACLLYAQYLERIGRKEDKLTLFLVEIFEKLTDARFVNRLFGTPAMWSWFCSVNSRKSPEHFLEKLMALAMLFYYPLEHAWWLTTLNTSINQFIAFDGLQASLWSLRAWAVYVVLDVIRTRMALKRLAKLPNKRIEDVAEQRRLKLWLQSCLCDFILAVQYSVVQGPFPAPVVAFAGWYGGMVGMYLKLADFTKQKTE